MGAVGGGGPSGARRIALGGVAAVGAGGPTGARMALGAAAAALLAGPTALAFFSGGYFAEARAWAGVAAWLLVALGLLAAPGSRRPSGAPLLAILCLAGLAGWTLLSILWAPIAGAAYGAGQIALLYLGALIASILLLGTAPVAGWVTPTLAAGTLVVIGYGLSERLLPGVLHFARSVSAQGRLEQPLTYWNAMGELAAIGFVLCAALAGEADRSRWLRGAAAAAAVALAVGLYVSFSRGALFAALAGAVALAVIAPRRERLLSLLLCLVAGALGAAVAAPSRGVTALAGSASGRERAGALTLAALVLLAGAAFAGQWALADRGPRGALELPRGVGWAAAGVVCAGLAGAIVLGAHESSSASSALSGGATRLVTLQSNRYAYWDVALRAFADSPLHGVGAGGWSVWWLRWRTVNEFAQDAHSLELQTLAELGVVGLALLLGFFAAVAAGARCALARTPAAAGAVAALVVYLVHSPLDWDWQMPAVTLVAVVLAGWVLALTRNADDAPARAHRRAVEPVNTAS